MDKVLIIGSEGMVGSRFVELYGKKLYLITPSFKSLNILDKESLWKFSKVNKVSTLINFAAYTDTGMAEKERNAKEGVCYKVNVNGVENLCQVFPKVQFIQISTDMVFPGDSKNPGPYGEKDQTGSLNNLSWYGYTKMEAEKTVDRYFDNKSAILRIIYPVRAKFDAKDDYFRKPLSLFDRGKLYPLFDDQQITISFIDEVCEVLNVIIDKKARGVFHATSADVTTPHKIISYMLEKVRGWHNNISKVSIDEYIKSTGETSLRYPKYGGLSATNTAKYLGVKFSNSTVIVDKLISQGLGIY